VNCKTRKQWLNGVDFNTATKYTLNLSKDSQNNFILSQSILFFTSGIPCSLTLTSLKGTNDTYLFTANAFFKGIALHSVVTQDNIFYAPALLGFGTRDATLSAKQVTLNFVPVNVGTYTLFGGVPGFEQSTKIPLRMVIGGNVNNTIQIPELSGYNTSLQLDARRNGSNYVWKSVQTLDLILHNNAPNYDVHLLAPYIISLTQLQSYPSHTFTTNLFNQSIWRKVQDSNTELRVYYLDSVTLLQKNGSFINDTVQLFLIPATNQTIGTKFPYIAYLGNDTSAGLQGNFVLADPILVNISGLVNPKFTYDLKYDMVWVVTSSCFAAVVVAVAFVSVVRSHFF